jgi:pimeloyl-ACP methyl ester carboxylesterase
MYFNFENTAIHYKVNGKGRAVVLLHGFLESSDMWKEYAKELAKKFKVILIDLTGHGQSGFFSNTTTIDRMAAIVNALVDHLELSKVQMLGHSLGGYVSLAFAELFPEKLESLILFHSTAYADSEEVLAKRVLAVEMLKNHPKLYIKQTIKGLFREETLKNFEFEVERLIDNALKVKPTGYIGAVEAMKTRPERIHVLQSNIPKYFIAGRFDPVISFESSIEQIKHINNGSSKFLEQSGHMGFVEEKETAFQLIAQFLNMDKS